MAYEIEQRFEHIGTEILEASRNALYINMRYLDVALSGLAWEMTTDISRIGTDGLRLLYEPHYLADLYRKHPMLVNRVYLHIIFHCVFRHILRPCPKDQKRWHLACDVAVESLIDGMHHRSIRMSVSPLRRSLYQELRKELKVLTAEGIYRILGKMDLNEVRLQRLAEEFSLDDHTYWPAPPERNDKQPIPPNAMMRTIQKKWDDVSSRMQTELTMGRESGQEDGDLVDELAVENRERYDYKEFLRKFAVLKEETEIDPDSFDYVFYSYGLRVYGNMPLIEPQEWREVKKIEEFVIVIDTSMSCSGELVRKFLEETRQVLSDSGSYFKKVHIRDTSKVLIILSISLLLVVMEDSLNTAITFSALIAIMFIGIGLQKKREVVAKRISVKYGKLWVAAEVFLFVLVGATVNVGYLGKIGVKALVVIAGALVFRMLGVFVCLLGTSLKKTERLFAMMAYTPKATVQAAIGGIPLAMGFACGDTVLTVAVLAIVLTAPLGAFAIDFSYKKLLEKSK